MCHQWCRIVKFLCKVHADCFHWKKIQLTQLLIEIKTLSTTFRIRTHFEILDIIIQWINTSHQFNKRHLTLCHTQRDLWSEYQDFTGFNHMTSFLWCKYSIICICVLLLFVFLSHSVYLEIKLQCILNSLHKIQISVYLPLAIFTIWPFQSTNAL